MGSVAPTGREGPWARGRRGLPRRRLTCGGREQTLCRVHRVEITVSGRSLHRRTPAAGGGNEAGAVVVLRTAASGGSASKASPPRPEDAPRPR